MTDFKWWFSQDRERWQGPFTTKNEAIRKGHGTYANESFYICEARLEDYHQMVVDPEEVLEQLADRYMEFSSEEHGLFEDVSATNKATLGGMLTKTLHEWIDAYQIKTGIYMFAESRNEETIEPENK